MNFDKKIPPLEQQRLNNNLSHFADVGNINEVSHYIWNGAEVNSKDNHGDTPLRIAAYSCTERSLECSRKANSK